jgi:hypothetical protein
MAANDVFLCTPPPPNDVKLYDPAVGCGGGTSVLFGLGQLILTGLEPVINFIINMGLGQLVLNGYEMTVSTGGSADPTPIPQSVLPYRGKFSQGGSPMQRIKVVRNFEQ